MLSVILLWSLSSATVTANPYFHLTPKRALTTVILDFVPAPCQPPQVPHLLCYPWRLPLHLSTSTSTPSPLLSWTSSPPLVNPHKYSISSVILDFVPSPCQPPQVLHLLCYPWRLPLPLSTPTSTPSPLLSLTSSLPLVTPHKSLPLSPSHKSPPCQPPQIRPPPLSTLTNPSPSQPPQVPPLVNPHKSFPLSTPTNTPSPWTLSESGVVLCDSSRAWAWYYLEIYLCPS